MAADRKERGLEINRACLGRGRCETLERIGTLVPSCPDLVAEF